MKLTVKQQKFVAAYVELGNATQAALQAGYSENYAKAQSSKLLVNVGIKTAIDKRLKEIDSAKIMSSKEIMETLSAIARGEKEEEVIITFKDDFEKTHKTADHTTRIKAMHELMKRFEAAEDTSVNTKDWSAILKRTRELKAKEDGHE